MRNANINAGIPKAAFYVWAEVPQGIKSVDFCEQMLDDIGVSTTPGNVFGQFGEGFMRISLITPIARMREGIELMADWLAEKV